MPIRSVDGVVLARPGVNGSISNIRRTSAAPDERVSPKWSPRTQSFETLGSKVDPRRANALEAGVSGQLRAGKLTSLQQPIRRQFAKPVRSTKEKTGPPQWLQMPLIIGGAMLAGLAFQNVVLGQLAVITYGAAAVMFRIPSRVSFILALLAMLATLGLLVFKGDVGLSQNFAVYTFLFLVVGVFTLNRELKKEGGRIYSSRQTRNPH